MAPASTGCDYSLKSGLEWRSQSNSVLQTQLRLSFSPLMRSAALGPIVRRRLFLKGQTIRISVSEHAINQRCFDEFTLQALYSVYVMLFYPTLLHEQLANFLWLRFGQNLLKLFRFETSLSDQQIPKR